MNNIIKIISWKIRILIDKYLQKSSKVKKEKNMNIAKSNKGDCSHLFRNSMTVICKRKWKFDIDFHLILGIMTHYRLDDMCLFD